MLDWAFRSKAHTHPTVKDFSDVEINSQQLRIIDCRQDEDVANALDP